MYKERKKEMQLNFRKTIEQPGKMTQGKTQEMRIKENALKNTKKIPKKKKMSRVSLWSSYHPSYLDKFNFGIIMGILTINSKCQTVESMVYKSNADYMLAVCAAVCNVCSDELSV